MSATGHERLQATKRTRQNLTNAAAGAAMSPVVEMAFHIVNEWLDAEARRLQAPKRPKRRWPANVIPFTMEGGVQ